MALFLKFLTPYFILWRYVFLYVFSNCWYFFKINTIHLWYCINIFYFHCTVCFQALLFKYTKAYMFYYRFVFYSVLDWWSYIDEDCVYWKKLISDLDDDKKSNSSSRALNTSTIIIMTGDFFITLIFVCGLTYWLKYICESTDNAHALLTHQQSLLTW